MRDTAMRDRFRGRKAKRRTGILRGDVETTCAETPGFPVAGSSPSFWSGLSTMFCPDEIRGAGQFALRLPAACPGTLRKYATFGNAPPKAGERRNSAGREQSQALRATVVTPVPSGEAAYNVVRISPSVQGGKSSGFSRTTDREQEQDRLRHPCHYPYTFSCLACWIPFLPGCATIPIFRILPPWSPCWRARAS